MARKCWKMVSSGRDHTLQAICRDIPCAANLHKIFTIFRIFLTIFTPSLFWILLATCFSIASSVFISLDTYCCCCFCIPSEYDFKTMFSYLLVLLYQLFIHPLLFFEQLINLWLPSWPRRAETWSLSTLVNLSLFRVLALWIYPSCPESL